MKIQKLVLFCAVFALLHTPVYGLEKFKDPLVTKAQSEIEDEKQHSSSTIGAIISTSVAIIGVIGYIFWKQRKPQNPPSRIDQLSESWKKTIKATSQGDIPLQQQEEFLEVLDKTLTTLSAMNLNQEVYECYYQIIESGIRTGSIPITQGLLGIILLNAKNNLLDREMVAILFTTNRLTIEMLPESVTNEIRLSYRKSTKLSELDSKKLEAYAKVMQNFSNKGSTS